MVLTGICMCGHPSSVHTNSGSGCAAKFINYKRQQVECECTSFCDKGDPNS